MASAGNEAAVAWCTITAMGKVLIIEFAFAVEFFNLADNGCAKNGTGTAISLSTLISPAKMVDIMQLLPKSAAGLDEFATSDVFRFAPDGGLDCDRLVRVIIVRLMRFSTRLSPEISPTVYMLPRLRAFTI
jgi:hypothetical protein